MSVSDSQKNAARIVIFLRSGVLMLAFLPAMPALGRDGPGRGKPPQNSEPPPDNIPPASQAPPDNEALKKAEAELLAARAAAKSAYESAPAWTTAVANLQAAENENDSAVKPVLQAEKGEASYLAAAADLAKAENKMATLRQADDSNPTEMSDAATAAMTARATLRSLEQHAVAADPAAAAAQQKLKDAQNAMTQLRSDEPKSIDADSAVITAQQEVAAAKNSN